MRITGQLGHLVERFIRDVRQNTNLHHHHLGSIHAQLDGYVSLSRHLP